MAAHDIDQAEGGIRAGDVATVKALAEQCQAHRIDRERDAAPQHDDAHDGERLGRHEGEADDQRGADQRAARQHAPPVDMVGQPADRPLQGHVADDEGRKPQRAGLRRDAGADRIDRQETEGDLFAQASRKGRQHGQRRRHEDGAVATVGVMPDRRRPVPVGQQRQGDQKGEPGAGQERHRPVDADDLQHQGSQRHAAREHRGIDRHDPAAPLLLDDEVHPDLAHHPRHAADRAVQEGEHEPGDRTRGQRIADRAQGTGQDGGQDERHGAEAGGQSRNVGPGREHAERPGGGDDADGELVLALPLQRERHQRHHRARLQTDGGAGGEDGN